MIQSEQNASNWREEIQILGKSYFEIQDMIRLGFLKINTGDLEQLKKQLVELNQISTELYRLKKELDGVEDITPIIKEIRKNRIERVRAKRAIRKVEREKEEEKRKAEISEKRKTTPSYLGEKIAEGLIFQGQDEELLQSLSLPHVKDLLELSQLIQLSREELLWLCYHRQSARIDHYTRFQIPKRKGGFRTISAPKSKMRIAQKWVLENILSKVPVHESAMAFLEGKSIVDNAERHLHKNLLIRLDLKDFFPSIKFPRVKGLFKSFGYSPGMATIFALLCTDAMRLGASLGDKKYYVALGDRYLPQGSCTSPAISNIICRKLDNRLSKLAQSMGWTYSRYADDLVFSHEDKDAELKNILGLTKKIIADENFILNEEKTLVMRPHQRQTVTGIVVNHDELRISRRDLRRFRAFLHQYEQVGQQAMSEKLGKNAIQYGRGYLAFIQMVNPQQAEKIIKKHAWLAV
ncbi:MAG: retron St85 family RNA-directed DNA polymerase [Microscillaceae bacterium]|nr:retron St85 family RNA-directed DNA polymerase [Microscillaceae bacterium]